VKKAIYLFYPDNNVIMKKHLRKPRNLILSLIWILIALPVMSQSITSAGIDSLIEKSMKTFDVPGIAVAVIKDGKVIHAKGYGMRSIKTQQKMDEFTLFAIASNSKAFTSAALGMLVDEGKLSWDSRVIDFIPEFRLYNPYVTEEFTIRDLLTHRSGMGLGAGDLMIWPDSAIFTKEEIIHNLRYLKPVSSFRSKYDYDNLLYIVAGEVVKRASGMSWEDFIEKRIMHPLKMNSSAASYNRLPDKSNVIDAHVPVDDHLWVVSKGLNETANAAAGIYSNITDMARWVIMQMNDGKYGDGLTKHLFSEKVHNEMWSPQTIIPVRKTSAYNTHFMSYGLGWRLRDIRGYKEVSHTGALLGILTQVTLLPELKLGIIVFTNQQSGAAFYSITNTILDSYLGVTGVDRVEEFHNEVLNNEAEAKKITYSVWKDITAQQKTTSLKIDYNVYSGTYIDNWFGEISISVKNGKLWFVSRKSPKLTGEMLYYKGNTFVVKWLDRSLDADAFANFALDNNGKATSIKMEAISPLADFSFDFQDLDFQRINE
jgi:CubicO group peptidase (beta-lactamase class C family)